jgi:hypothetical protein
VPYSAEEWTPEAAGLPEWEADEGAVQEMKQTLFLFNQDKPSYARYGYSGAALSIVTRWAMH